MSSAMHPGKSPGRYPRDIKPGLRLALRRCDSGLFSAKIDLAEARQSVLDGPAELLALNICILFKSDFGSWTKANGRRRIERGRAAGPCAEKFCGDKSFRKLDRPRSDQAQAQSHILRSSFERPRPMSVTSRGQARSRVASGHSQSRTIEADLNKRGRYDRPISGAMLPALWRR
jgi:hypothetical protein